MYGLHQVANDEILPTQRSKIIMLGSESTGKTSIVSRAAYDTFDLTYQPTIGIDFISKVVHADDGTAVRFQIWDTAGQERYNVITPSYIRDSAIAVVVYDITSLLSFERVETYIQMVRTERGDDVSLFLVGNKHDLENSRVITEMDGKEKAFKHGAHFVETSAKNSKGVKKLFRDIAHLVIAKRREAEPQSELPYKTIVINLNGNNNNRGTSLANGCQC